MKGLFLRIIAAFALLLWAIDMVFPWQKIMQSEQNPYTAIKNRGSLIVGTINNPIYYFIGNEGESGLEYELAKNFADYLGVRLQIKTLENNDQLFNELENNNIDIAAANLLFQPQRAEKFQLGPSYTSASWQLVYKKGENRPKDLAQVQQEIYDIAGETFNINSPKQLGVILFEKMNLPIIKKTKTGYSTDAEVLDMLRHESPIVEKILAYRSVAKLVSTYCEGLAVLINDKTHRIHTTFNQMVTATGRLSSSDPNLQNIPVRTEKGREIRALFYPGTGYDTLVSADYSQIELRILAHLSGDEALIKAFVEGKDIHRFTAAEVLGKSQDEVTSEERSHAKAINFGIIYGISDFGLSRDLGITRGEAKNYIDLYFSRYPKVKEYMDRMVQEAHETGKVRTMFGRQRELPDINSRNFNRRSFAERTAMNTPIQGTAADIIKLAMNQVEQKLEEQNFTSRLLLQVHDELVLEVVNSELEAIEELLRSTMQSVVELQVPLIVDVHHAENWALVK